MNIYENKLGTEIICEIQEKSIDLTNLISKMKEKSAGALSIFLGTTRDNFCNKKVKKLFYEAHPTMALKKLNQIACYAYSKWNLNKIAIIHRIGEVPILEESIVIISTSIHRKAAIESTEFCIDEVKKVVPIWKKEFYEDGGEEWKENSNCIHLNK